jgi:hypothetical protein
VASLVRRLLLQEVPSRHCATTSSSNNHHWRIPMRRFITVLTAAFAVVAFSSMVFAQAATQTPVPDKKVAVKTVKPAPLSASGTVAKLDEATKTLTVTTKDGDKDFTLAADAKIMSGAKAMTIADLTGKTVKVTYTVVDTKNVASKVTIAPEPKAAKVVKEVKK